MISPAATKANIPVTSHQTPRAFESQRFASETNIETPAAASSTLGIRIMHSRE